MRDGGVASQDFLETEGMIFCAEGVVDALSALSVSDLDVPFPWLWFRKSIDREGNVLMQVQEPFAFANYVPCFRGNCSLDNCQDPSAVVPCLPPDKDLATGLRGG